MNGTLTFKGGNGMKRRILTGMLVIAAVIFSACTVTYGSNGTADTGKAYLSITAGDESADRALLPTGFDFATNTSVSFTLLGTIAGGTEQTIGIWAADGTTPAYNTMAADTSKYVDAGVWSFTLKVTNADVLVLTKTLTDVTIGEGENALAFGELEEPADGKGNVSITLKYPHLATNAVTEVTATMFNFDGSAKIANATQTIVSGTTQDSVVYTATDVASGSYLITFYLYDTVNEVKTLINPYTEYVRVATGCLTEDTCVIEDLNTIYTITYVLNEGQFTTTAPGSFNDCETITMPSAKRTGYTFDGWFETSDFSGTALTGWAPETKAANVTVYAKWTPNSLKITATAPKYVGKDLNLAYTTSGTVATFTVDSGYASYIWYFDGTKVASATTSTWALDTAGASPVVKPGKHQILVIVEDSANTNNMYSAVMYFKYTK